jgi:hypothetical protein
MSVYSRDRIRDHSRRKNNQYAMALTRSLSRRRPARCCPALVITFTWPHDNNSLLVYYARLHDIFRA